MTFHTRLVTVLATFCITLTGNTGSLLATLGNASVLGSVSIESSVQEDIVVAIDPAQVPRGGTSRVAFNFRAGCSKLLDKILTVETKSKELLETKGIVVSGLTKVSDSGGGACLAYATIVIRRDVEIGEQRFKLEVGGDNPVDIPEIKFTITESSQLTPGPIPPGIDPQVDIMWGVVPSNIVKDNFGGKVDKRFYCIELVIGNNSGFSLQIAAVGFKLGPTGQAAELIADSRVSIINEYRDLITRRLALEKQAVGLKADCNRAAKQNTSSCVKLADINDQVIQLKAAEEQLIATSGRISSELATLSRISPETKIPSSSYAMTRGTASHGQFWNLRNVGLGGLRALGPIFTSLNPFFGAAKEPKITQIFNILTNPLAEGIDSVFPDKTIAQLQRLDDQALRDGMIIDNNAQIRTRIFIPRRSLGLNKYKNDVAVITDSLGDMILVGDLIEYINRVNVTSRPSGAITPPPTIDPASVDSFVQGESGVLSLTGTNLKGAQVSSSSKLVVVGMPTSTENTVSVPIEIEDTAPVGTYTLFVSTSRGSQEIKVRVNHQIPAVDEEALAVDSVSGEAGRIVGYRDKSEIYDVSIKGKYLSEAKLEPAEETKGKIFVRNLRSSTDGTSLSATIEVAKGTRAGKYPFRLVNPAGTSEEKSFVVEVLKKDPPVLSGGVRYGANGDLPAPTANPERDLDYEFILDGSNLSDLKLVENDSSKKFKIVITSVTDKQVRGKITIPANHEGPTGAIELEDIDSQRVSFRVNVSAQPPIVINDSGAVREITVPEGGSSTIILNGRNFEGIGGSVSAGFEGWTVEVKIQDPSTTILTIEAPENYEERESPMEISLKNSNPEKVVIRVKIKKPSDSD